MFAEEKLTINTDGGSRGNPGPAASAFVVQKEGKEIYKAAKFIGKATNNIAEYTAVLLAADWLLQNFKGSKVLEINFILDSELVVKQINGLYKVKDENIKKIYLKIVDTLKSLNASVTFQHVRREKNKIADFLVNEELDANSQSLIPQ
jgi:ribonuclease HI